MGNQSGIVRVGFERVDRASRTKTSPGWRSRCNVATTCGSHVPLSMIVAETDWSARSTAATRLPTLTSAMSPGLGRIDTADAALRRSMVPRTRRSPAVVNPCRRMMASITLRSSASTPPGNSKSTASVDGGESLLVRRARMRPRAERAWRSRSITLSLRPRSADPEELSIASGCTLHVQRPPPTRMCWTVSQIILRSVVKDSCRT
jgi:hypothetical protein